VGTARKIAPGHSLTASNPHLQAIKFSSAPQVHFNRDDVFVEITAHVGNGQHDTS
jgi:hypothetical protein